MTADHGGEHVSMADVARLLERVLGLHPEDWIIRRWDTEYEGWAGSLVRTCLCDQTKCWCCDPVNLDAKDIALIEAALSTSREQQP